MESHIAEWNRLYRERLARTGLSPLSEWQDIYVLETVFKVGRYGKMGSHTHLVELKIVREEKREHKPGAFGVGDAFSSEPLCNQNRGQHSARAFEGECDTVTCEKCLAILARVRGAR